MARGNPKPDPNEAITNRLLENIQAILAAGLPSPTSKPPTPTPSAPKFPSQATATPAFPTLVNQPNLPTPQMQGPPNPNAPNFPSLGNAFTPSAPHFPTLTTPTSYKQIPPPPTPPQLTRRPKQRSRLGNALRPLTTRIKRAVGPRARKNFKGAARAAGAHFRGALPGGGRSELAQAASGVKGVGDLAGMVPGVGGAAGGVLKFIAGTLEATDKLKELSQSLHEADMLFAEFSGAMATVKAERYAQEITLGRERGDRRASSAQYLSEGQMDLKRVTAPIEDLSAMVKDRVVGLMDRAMARLLEPLASMAEKILKWFDDDEDDASRGIDMFDALNETWNRHRNEVMGTRPRGMQP